MNTNEYKPTLTSNFSGYIQDKYLAIEIVLSMLLGVSLGFWTVLSRADYAFEVALRRYDPVALLTVLYTVFAFFGVKKVRALIHTN